MARGGRKLAELVDKLDLIVEVRDARAPFSTSAPLVSSFSKLRPVLRVLSKRDLASPERTKAWLDELGPGSWAVDLRKKDGLAPLRRVLLERKPAHRELRLAVMGIPNVGKSMLLNALVGKAQAHVGGIPGVTRSVSWYRNEGLLVVDSPGILDPHAEPGVHQILSWLGCAKARACITPVNWRLAPPEIAFILKDAGAQVLVCGADYADVVDTMLGEVELHRLIQFEPGHARWPAFRDWIGAHPDRDPKLPALEDD